MRRLHANSLERPNLGKTNLAIPVYRQGPTIIFVLPLSKSLPIFNFLTKNPPWVRRKTWEIITESE
ncbi:hypothetical protein A2376_02940 [Candidatus Woesebacteria bacterium RIFOXYB1_FULL_47_31]|uniref:Uncharacterized protein n=2 Tax=Candidatus Woeseibacteriota TaxID=1752722 RepID=A0A1F8D5U4_9BACT|nr:MAG: hypothetical protein A2197_02935 [Candidatus Woesebacteria bacterium RIFOXYA1_FULL_48_16]OGM83409.1 MAG: hypothetical protein A2376_02940 [Candidatus Woesebacteria bacterium RIFOXYB1_FULL_47_31]